MPSITTAVTPLEELRSEEEDGGEHLTWMVERTETIMAAAASTAVMISQEEDEPGTEKLHKTFVPHGFEAIRQIYSGVKHWSRGDGIPCCPPSTMHLTKEISALQRKRQTEPATNA